jgi:hypothetical protein
VIGDLFSRYVVAVAVADESAKTVAGVLFERCVAIFGPPESLLSDRGRAFRGRVMTELCDRMGTGRLLTSISSAEQRIRRTLQ